MRPSVLFWAAAVLYIITAVISKVIYSDLLPPPEAAPLVYALAFLWIMAVFYLRDWKINCLHKSYLYLAVMILVLSPLGWWGFATAVATIVTTRLIVHYEARNIERNPDNARKELRLILTTVVLVLFLVPIFRGAVPILRPETRYSAFRFFYLAAGYFTVVILSLKPDFRIFLLGEAIALVSTFRTIGLAVALAYFLRLVQLRGLGYNIKGRKYMLPAAAMVLIGVFLARYYVTTATYPEWQLGFLETLLYRPGVTYTVYEKLFHLGMPWGERGILFSTDPKGYVGSLFGRNVGYTYTIFGQPAYDFGLFGLIEAAFLGMALQDAERRRPTAVLAVTLMTLMIPIGIDAFFLSAMAFLAYLSVEVDVWKKDR
ncbi:hypothetical protein CL1_0506 [Thermococcus cleftensis]|uniref:Oligosaccharide repeat unit polymerase n=1 Tax=Thermococcus cleftensis (strain DSM 27260 / KACC 17922 / CL1) TaxID=163003 RepID=I3ZSN0_THECF|nr:hypothetical protein [Thermococcus cleftensis]AFL94714.1 hypothetical protein CL1_0506 [Thermococcus cleftensis]